MKPLQIATPLACIEQRAAIDNIVAAGSFADEESRRLARIGLANYFAGAFILPHTAFGEIAEACRYAFSQPDCVLTQLARMPDEPT
jgi:predicted transcriptional regulator